MFDINDKVVFITGAASGIGASVVRTLLDEGARHIAILDITEESGKAIEEELNTKHGCKIVKFIKCDITQKDQLLKAYESVTKEQGYIDVVINCAGIFNDGMFDKEIEVNLTALVRSSLQALELMRKDKGGIGGTIINVASVAAICSIPEVPVYSCTKSAVLKFSTALGDEIHFSRTGVRILCVCFGVTDTTLISREKICSFDPVLEDEIIKVLKILKWQTPEHAAKGLLEMYKNGKSGSVWTVTGGRPAQDVTNKYIQNIEMFNDVI